jgi:hypothetical protein
MSGRSINQTRISAAAVSIVFGVLTAGYAIAQSSMVAAIQNVCPSRSHPVGADYCQADGSWQYIEANDGLCPSGTQPAGAGYCEVNNGHLYIKANGAVCPSGTQPVGAGYCEAG